MRFVYKIHSGYDGFRPGVIPQRMGGTPPARMAALHRRGGEGVGVLGLLPWAAQVRARVYAQGIVDGVDHDALEVSLRVRHFDSREPIASPEINAQVAALVAPRYRQVFVWPDEWTDTPRCSLAACKARRCGDCQTWAGFPLIEEGHSSAPSRVPRSASHDVVAAHWVVPRRCYETKIVPGVRAITRRFTDFKMGRDGVCLPVRACHVRAAPQTRQDRLRLRRSDPVVARQGGERRGASYSSSRAGAWEASRRAGA